MYADEISLWAVKCSVYNLPSNEHLLCFCTDFATESDDTSSSFSTLKYFSHMAREVARIKLDGQNFLN